jgi:hypothetical protein
VGQGQEGCEQEGCEEAGGEESRAEEASGEGRETPEGGVTFFSAVIPGGPVSAFTRVFDALISAFTRVFGALWERREPGIHRCKSCSDAELAQGFSLACSSNASYSVSAF